MYEILTWFAAWDSHAALQSRSHVIIIQFCNQDYLLHNQHYIFHEVAFFSRRSIILLCPAVRYWSALLQFITFRKPSRMQQLACSSFNNLANICCSFAESRTSVDMDGTLKFVNYKVGGLKNPIDSKKSNIFFCVKIHSYAF